MYTVVIADDEAIERNYLKSVFEKYPEQYFLAGEAINGEQVIEIALEKKPNIIIMDINMPIYNGLVAAKHIKTILNNTIIILNSAYAEFEFARQAIDYNLDAYLLKPASEKDILNTITSCFRKKKLNGQLNGSYNNISKNLNNEYPYSVIDHLINALCEHNFQLIRFNVTRYLDFLKSQQNHLEEYRLYIINTIFSIVRELQKIIPESILILLNCGQRLQKISKAEYWYEILELTEDFFKGVLFLFCEDSCFPLSCADMVANYIDENFYRQINLDKLGELFHFSPSYISRVFHQSKGVTIKNYLNQKRVNHAVKLLQGSNLEIKEVASSCGFINISHFNRVFKEVTGKTPLEVKKEGSKYHAN